MEPGALILQASQQRIVALSVSWLTHELAARSVPVGALVAIQPALCVFLVPLVTACAAHVPALRMITAGAAVSSLALLWLVASVSIWAVVLFMVTLAVGEAMWSPRLFEYSAIVSPAGASCTWSALGAMPMFLAKLPTGLLSGALLEKVRAQRIRLSRVFHADWHCVFFPDLDSHGVHSSAQRRVTAGRAPCGP